MAQIGNNSANAARSWHGSLAAFWTTTTLPLVPLWHKKSTFSGVVFVGGPEYAAQSWGQCYFWRLLQFSAKKNWRFFTKANSMVYFENKPAGF
jgi:hypothetical protein